MSLLPQQIPPQTQPLGMSDAAGNVTIDQNWWLYFFNIGKQVLSAPSAPIPVTPANILALSEDDTTGSDIQPLAHQIENLNVMVQGLLDPYPTSLDVDIALTAFFIPGLDGDQGDEGMLGPMGSIGVQGVQGFAIPGLDGSDADDGIPIPGPTGASGIDGDDGMGFPGQDGLDGEDGYPIPGPAGASGIDGDDGIPIVLSEGESGDEPMAFPPGPTGSLSLYGNLIFNTTVAKITGPFSSSAPARPLFQSSTVNGSTIVSAIPNGTSTSSQLSVFNASNPANSSFGEFLVSSTAVSVISDINGSGSQLPIQFTLGGVLAAQFLAGTDFNTVTGRTDTSYDYHTPATGFSITIPNHVYTEILDPASTLATGTIKMPSTPNDGQVVRISSSQTITALTLSPNTGQSVQNAPTTLTVNTTGAQGYEFIYRAANTTWYRLQ